MIRMNKRATPPFWGEPDDQYDTGARSTTALELRDFGVDANSRLPNRRREHGRDKGVEVADTYVILNTNPVHGLGPFKDGHAALGIVSDDGDPEKNVVWDPNGYYPDPEMGTERTLVGPDASIQKLMDYQLTDGDDVVTFQFDTTTEQEEAIRERIEQLGGEPATDLGLPWGCTSGVSRAIDGIGPFGKVDETMWPSKLREQFERDMRFKGKVTGRP